jgi:hypothetical protein
MERVEIRRKEEIDAENDISQKSDWNGYIKVPHRLQPISIGLKDKYQKEKRFRMGGDIFLPKDEYEHPSLAMARQMKDDVVFGKPNFNLYHKGQKPEDLNNEFGTIEKKPYKSIY